MATVVKTGQSVYIVHVRAELGSYVDRAFTDLPGARAHVLRKHGFIPTVRSGRDTWRGISPITGDEVLLHRMGIYQGGTS